MEQSFKSTCDNCYFITNAAWLILVVDNRIRGLAKINLQGILINLRFRLRLLFSLKPKEMAKMRLLATWIDQK